MNGIKANILGVSLNSSSRQSLLDQIIALAGSQSNLAEPAVIFTPNPEFMVEAWKDADFKDLLNKSDINLPDGVGLVLAGKILGQLVSERVSGADMVESILQTANSLPLTADHWTVGIAGARRGVSEEAEELIKRLERRYSKVRFVNLDKKFEIRNSKFEIVFATHGMKKQEQWIWENKNKIETNVFMGVGGSLDFLTDFSRRAPVTIRKIGLEWLWRGLRRPGHFKRVWKATAVFGGLVISEKLRLVFGLNSKQP